MHIHTNTWKPMSTHDYIPAAAYTVYMAIYNILYTKIDTPAMASSSITLHAICLNENKKNAQKVEYI